MQAIILAAGMGKRLKNLTAGNTKCMVEVNGVSLIKRALDQLDGLALSQIVIVVGYEGQRLIDYIGTLDIETPIVYVDNPIYDTTNNIYSLWLAKNYLVADDTLLLESDIIFEEGLLEELVEDPRPTLALVDKYESWMDGTVLKLDEYDSILAFVPGKRLVFDEISDYYKTVNIYKFAKDFSEQIYVPFLEAYQKALGANEYYEQVLGVIIMLKDSGLRAKRLNGEVWYEIDDAADLDIACTLFFDDEGDHLDAIASRFGGYWRYPRLKDFCYLVNPFYPPKRLTDEMKANFETLIAQYPSGMRVNALLASKNFGISEPHIVVGNGAAELIKALMDGLAPGGKVGFIRPTFDEYPNRYPAKDSVVFIPDTDTFSYGTDDICGFFDTHEVSMLVLVNPDNPTGNYIPRADLIRLADWAEEHSIRLLVDESFTDFAEEDDSSLLDDHLLESHPHLIVMKSISKSYGVPGLRLGILASGDVALVAALKKEVAIWNINSFAEFYLQIAEKYRADYATSLEMVKDARRKLCEALATIPCLRVFPSQANYVMCELLGDVSARELTKRLLTDHDLLVKDLSPKMRQPGRSFLRLAVRDEFDNEVLVAAIAEVLEQSR